ncbi:MAG: hypothetical protein LBS00_12300 [Synergistaceae bacterium]|nr:hypothetical protein [Synergistaceae bacterium]
MPEQRQQKNPAFVPEYDVTSKERYVDSTSQKSEFDRVLDELGRISQETLSWDILRLTRKHFGDTEEHKARKFEAFMGAFVINAATELYDRGLVDVAFAKLEQAKTILEAKRKLAQEVEAIRAKTEEDAFDVFAILGLGTDDDFSGGDETGNNR